ncbi:bar adaptor protein [Sporothrix brasiliensis 5110]|uniref:Bar adaptor protein n=1 Tax=Sporothrix brasiliensis 5110 TaxID=1398154 RepID=A0A0C2INL4_9PEZI|nr:bar adaptor protein [Sporothrix brasiliensis 5110]KIH88570.1 bar adaptor protein [Sporothrix brasiliensis 5110]
MSFKGFSKGIARAPQQFRQKFNMGEQTKDPIYLDAERRFDDLEAQTKKLHEESKRYAEAINGMLTHQIEFSQAIAEIYKPISGSVSDPDSFIAEGNVEGIRACEEYEAVVKDLQETLKPELEMIESRVVQPADELLVVIQAIRKCAVKREHKKLDYDRHRAALKKLQDKKEKSLKDEKALYKAEADLEQSTQDFDYFNDLLKDELPKLFSLERQFIQPLFQSFYYMQLNVFYTLHEKMQQVDIGYFNLTLDVQEAFDMKRGDIQERTEKLSIVKFRTTGGRRPGQPPKSKYGNRLAIEGRKDRPLAITQGPSSGEYDSASPPGSPATGNTATYPYRSRASSSAEHPPPPYSAEVDSSNSMTKYGSHVGSSASALAAAAKSKPPPPKPKPQRLSAVPAAETATALYDYAAAQDGDLSFSAGDVIEIVTRSDNVNEWWTGKLQGRQGQFPGNYVQVDG